MWSAGAFELTFGDVTGTGARKGAISAMAYIATPNRSQYQTALVNLGTAITGLTRHWVGLKTVEVASSYAIFNVTQNLGENLQYQVVMVKEDGQWRVDLF